MEDSSETEMHIVTNKEGQLIFDNCGRICLMDKKGNFCYVPREMLPESFFQEHSTALVPSPITHNLQDTQERQLLDENHIPERSLTQLSPERETQARQHLNENLIPQRSLTQLSPERETQPRLHLNENLIPQRSLTQLSPERETQPRLHLNENLIPQRSLTQLSPERETQPRLHLNENLIPQRSLTQLSPERETQPRLHLNDERAHWSRQQTLRLIYAYQKHRHIFMSNSIKNSVAWRKISEEIGTHSPHQCEIKFRYLKCQYTKKKDNMRSTSSGARALSFEFYEEFEDIFGTEPNIVPASLASSSTHEPQATPNTVSVSTASLPAPSASSSAPTTSLLDPSTSSSVPIASFYGPTSSSSPTPHVPQASGRPTTRRRTRLEIQLERFHKSMEQREQAREKRMERFIKAQEACTNKLCDMLQQFIDKM